MRSITENLSQSPSNDLPSRDTSEILRYTSLRIGASLFVHSSLLLSLSLSLFGFLCLPLLRKGESRAMIIGERSRPWNNLVEVLASTQTHERTKEERTRNGQSEDNLPGDASLPWLRPNPLRPSAGSLAALRETRPRRARYLYVTSSPSIFLFLSDSLSSTLSPFLYIRPNVHPYLCSHYLRMYAYMYRIWHGGSTICLAAVQYALFPSSSSSFFFFCSFSFVHFPLFLLLLIIHLFFQLSFIHIFIFILV